MTGKGVRKEVFYLLTTYTPICIIEIEIEIPVWV